MLSSDNLAKEIGSLSGDEEEFDEGKLYERVSKMKSYYKSAEEIYAITNPIWHPVSNRYKLNRKSGNYPHQNSISDNSYLPDLPANLPIHTPSFKKVQIKNTHF